MSISHPLWRVTSRTLRRAVPLSLTLGLSVGAAAIVSPAQAQVASERSLTLEQAITAAIDGDPGLRAAGAGVDAALGSRRQARARANPELGVEVENFNGRDELRGFDGAETTFTLSQQVDLSGQRRARIRVAERELHGAELDRVVRGLDLVRDVQSAYYEALAADERVAIERERLATAEALNVSVARRVNAARDPLMARARAEASLAEARIALVRAEAEARSARQQLASLAGLPEGFGLTPSDFALPQVLDHDHALSDDDPDLARAAAERDRASATVSLERSTAWANPNLTLGYRRFEDRDGDGALVAGFSIPLGVFDRNRGAVERARAEERRAELELEARRRAISREYATLQRAIETDAQAIRSIEQDVIPQAERALALARDGYDRGAFSYLDVLEAQRALTDARQRRIETLTSYHSNEAALDRLTARFVEAMPDQEIHQ